MKKQDIEKLIDSIDNKYIEEAANFNKPSERTKFRKLWLIAAACLLTACISIPTVLYATAPNESESFTEESDTEEISYPDIITDDINHTNIKLYAERYNGSPSTNNEAFGYSWLEMTDAELYTSLVYNGKTYSGSAYSSIDEADIGKSLGVHTLLGNDMIDDTVHSAEFEIFEVKGVSSEYRVAAAMDDGYYPFSAAAPKETLGDCLNALNLCQNMPLTDFYVNITIDGETPYSRINDPTKVWKILLQCGDAKYNKELSESMSWWQADHEYITFTAMSRKLGISGVVSVSRDGTLWTNIFSYARVYDIGIEKANAIIDYSLNNSSPTKRTPYEYWICGYIKEITEDHVLIDDTRLCENEKDGIVFKLNIKDKRVARGIKYENLKTGDLAVISVNRYGYIDEENQNTVNGINWISRGHIHDGDIVVFE